MHKEQAEIEGHPPCNTGGPNEGEPSATTGDEKHHPGQSSLVTRWESHRTGKQEQHRVYETNLGAE